MNKLKVGRPTDSIKNKLIKARIDKKTNDELEYCMRTKHISKSEVIREGIHQMYYEIKGDKWDLLGARHYC